MPWRQTVSSLIQGMQGLELADSAGTARGLRDILAGCCRCVFVHDRRHPPPGDGGRVRYGAAGRSVDPTGMRGTFVFRCLNPGFRLRSLARALFCAAPELLAQQLTRPGGQVEISRSRVASFSSASASACCRPASRRAA